MKRFLPYIFIIALCIINFVIYHVIRENNRESNKRIIAHAFERGWVLGAQSVSYNFNKWHSFDEIMDSYRKDSLALNELLYGNRKPIRRK